MARMPRVVVPGYPHHVTQRGNRKQNTFFSEADYRFYRLLVGKFAARANTKVWAYCLMPNHVHLVMVPSTEDGLRSALAEAHRRYTLAINKRYEWRGHLWQERFHSFPMDESHLMAAVRYVELNPVKAGLCERPDDWPWSSAAAHLSGKSDSLVDVKPMCKLVNNWRTFWGRDGTDDHNALLDQHLRTGRPLGNGAFVNEIESITGRSLLLKQGGRPSGRN